jgi:thiol:disulfide interchange protein DsbA
MQRRLVLKQMLAIGGLACFGAPALAQDGAGFDTLPQPQATEVAGKVEVIEFFSYGCPHCHDLDPLLDAWAKKLPKDVNFIRVPITFNRPQWEVLARLYYTLEAMGQLDQLHAAVFKALHEEREPIYKEDVLADWAAGKGLDRQKFMDTYKSFGVQSRMRRATQIAAAYRVNGVPLMAVGGKYLTSASKAGSFAKMLSVVDQLMATVRKDSGHA